MLIAFLIEMFPEDKSGKLTTLYLERHNGEIRYTFEKKDATRFKMMPTKEINRLVSNAKNNTVGYKFVRVEIVN